MLYENERLSLQIDSSYNEVNPAGQHQQFAWQSFVGLRLATEVTIDFPRWARFGALQKLWKHWSRQRFYLSLSTKAYPRVPGRALI